MSWWQNGVVYQIYPRSWADSDDDGVGDIQGIIGRLDHLEWLGVDAVWLNPITASADRDWGYDVTDYRAVHPDLGSPDDLDLLIKEARARDIDVILDLVPNHTSDQHPWFRLSRSSLDSEKRDWYVWHDAGSEFLPPNNWVRALGSGSAWTFDPGSQQFYLHSFLPEQPDLNWWNEEVRDAFDDIIRFWLDRGVAGFRIDVVNALLHDPELRGNPPVTPEDHPQVGRIGQRQVFNMNRPEVHDVIRRWRDICDSYEDPKILIGETYLFDLPEMARYYGENGSELHLTLNFPFVYADLDARTMASIVSDVLQLLPEGAAAAWAGSNHDAGRFMTRWCDDDPNRYRCAAMLLMTLPGTAFIYYGDEIGMTEEDIPRDRLLDPAGINRWPERGRDPARTPMRWDDRPGAGFTTDETAAWLPMGDNGACNVEDQLWEPTSHLHFMRRLINLRRESFDLKGSEYEQLYLDDHLWGYRRGLGTSVWLNLGPHHRVVIAEGHLVVATDRRVEETDMTYRLPPWSGMILQT